MNTKTHTHTHATGKVFTTAEEPLTVRGSGDFKPGRFYRCISAPSCHQKWLNCVAWRQRSDNKELGLLQGDIYVVLNGDGDLSGGGFDGHWANFSTDYHFRLMPLDVRVEITLNEVTSIKTVEQV